jgi:hypothetical protein
MLIELHGIAEVVGSNPSPGAYFEEPSISLKALAAESKVEEVTTTMAELTANTTEQKQTMTTVADTCSNSSRLQAPYSVAWAASSNLPRPTILAAGTFGSNPLPVQ